MLPSNRFKLNGLTFQRSWFILKIRKSLSWYGYQNEGVGSLFFFIFKAGHKEKSLYEVETEESLYEVDTGESLYVVETRGIVV